MRAWRSRRRPREQPHADRRAPRSCRAGVAITLWPPRKRATNSVAGFSNTSRGAPDLLDRALVHHDDEVGERQRLVLAVRDMDEGNAELTLQPTQFGAHAHAQERVERRQRLVEQQDLRMGDQRARQRDALLLPAGQLRGHALRRKASIATSSRNSIACSRRFALSTPRIFSEKATLSRQVRCGNSA